VLRNVALLSTTLGRWLIKCRAGRSLNGRFSDCDRRRGYMGKRSDRRIFRKRRQRTGFVLLASLAVVVVGAIMFSSLKPLTTLSAQGGETEPVQRVDPPMVDRAPEAAAETPTTDEAPAAHAAA